MCVLFLESERIMGTSKVHYASRKEQSLEDYFFELEQQMENDIICRDSICRNPENEKGIT